MKKKTGRKKVGADWEPVYGDDLPKPKSPKPTKLPRKDPCKGCVWRSRENENYCPLPRCLRYPKEEPKTCNTEKQTTSNT